jgi:arylsulfatase A
LEQNGIEKNFNQGEYGPRLVNDFALDFITRHKDQRFFLYYPMMLTHAPFQPTPDSPEWDAKAMGGEVNRNVKHFADMTAYMDKMIGRLDARLAELGIRDKTLLIFIGDNGTGRGVTSKFQGHEYKGGKGTTTRRGTHVPLIVSWPSVIRSGGVNRDLICSTDLFPTLCEAAGVKPPAELDGVSFLPQLRGEKGTPREWLYLWYSPRQQLNLTVREFAFDHHHKLYRSGEFFELAKDPFEEKALDLSSLAAEQSAAKAKLQQALDRFQNARPKELDRDLEREMQAAPKANARRRNVKR